MWSFLAGAGKISLKASQLNLLIQGPGPTVVAFHGHLHRSLQTLAVQLHSTEKMLKTFLVRSPNSLPKGSGSSTAMIPASEIAS